MTQGPDLAGEAGGKSFQILTGRQPFESMMSAGQAGLSA
jgi:hypothetical protein